VFAAVKEEFEKESKRARTFEEMVDLICGDEEKEEVQFSKEVKCKVPKNVLAEIFNGQHSISRFDG